MFRLFKIAQATLALGLSTSALADTSKAVVRMDFISIGAGIDNDALNLSLDRIAQDIEGAALTQFRAQRYGIEGEHALCAQGFTAETTEALARSLASFVTSTLVRIERANDCNLRYTSLPMRIPPAVRLDFNSMGAGINRTALQEALAAVSGAVRDNLVRDFRLTRWGREGENTLCVQAHDRFSNGKLLNALRTVSQANLVTASYPETCTVRR